MTSQYTQGWQRPRRSAMAPVPSQARLRTRSPGMITRMASSTDTILALKVRALSKVVLYAKIFSFQISIAMHSQLSVNDVSVLRLSTVFDLNPSLLFEVSPDKYALYYRFDPIQNI